MERQPLEKRFKEKIIVSDAGCWMWPFGKMKNGYSRIKIGYEKKLAHRVSYETFVGPIPAGLDLDHLCRNRGCVNPKHLEPVTRRENLRRGVGFIAEKARQTHCIRGHELSGENLRTNKNGTRNCKACIRQYSRREK